MIDMRIRVGVALICAAGISSVIMRYSVPSSNALSQAQPMAPVVDVSQMAKDLQTGSLQAGSALVAAVQSIKLPTVEIPTLVQLSTPSENSEPTPPAQVDNTPVEPSTPEEPPTSTPAFQPTTAPIDPIEPPIDIPSSTPSRTVPTTAPQPTKTPKPTKVPKPTEAVYPPITSEVRPGTSIEEIMREVEKRACVPYKLLMAIRTQESGVWFNNMSASTTKMYNTYGWWKTAPRATVCSGLAFYTQSGLIPAADSPTAYAESTDKTCTKAPIGAQNYDLKIMGIMQISEQEEQVTRKYTVKTIPGPFDRRVLFDNMLIFAIATKNRVGNNPQPSCSDWPEQTVKEAARTHASGSAGSCKYTYSQTGKSGDYCAEIWKLYQSFK
jgi:hypothetical protein